MFVLSIATFKFTFTFTFTQGEKNQWQMRRSQKMDKQEILQLQANLQAEIQAKQLMAEEMNKIKAANVANERQKEALLLDCIVSKLKENNKL